MSDSRVIVRYQTKYESELLLIEKIVRHEAALRQMRLSVRPFTRDPDNFGPLRIVLTEEVEDMKAILEQCSANQKED